jgi:myo-inositol-1(or 4)-monophosphatase
LLLLNTFLLTWKALITDDLVCPTDPVGNPVATETSMRGFGALSSKVRGLRVIACAAQVMAWVAHGKLSGYYSYDLNAWDVAAGALLIEEAGGQVTDMNNVPFTLRTRDMLCSQGGSVHGDVLETLATVNALSYEEESCELPDFLNVRRTKLDFLDAPKTRWYDSRGQN